MNHADTSADAVTAQILNRASGARVIWDFDGVVAHTEPLHEDSYRELATRRHYRFADDFFSELVGNTEDWIWHRVIDRGFPAGTDEIEELHAERGVVVAEVARAGLQPSWIASRLMPELAGVAVQQTVVSNGDPDLIEELLKLWRLDSFVTVARRGPGEDKEALFRSNCVPPCVVLEDSDYYLDIGRQLGAFTVGVRHSHNSQAALPADLTTSL